MLLFALALLFMLPCVSIASAESKKEAQDLSRYLAIEQSGHARAREELLNTSIDETVAYVQFEAIRLTWDNAPQKPAYLCILWGARPERVRLRQEDANGTILSDSCADPVFDAIIPLLPETKAMTIIADSAGMDIGRLALFTEGELPSPFFRWEETPKGMDYLLIATHPDDDVLFMGGIIPNYGAEQGYVGTVAYVTIPSAKRVNEAKQGAWEMGTVYRPLFLGFQDIREVTKEHYTHRFLQETVTLALVRMLREYRPLVVFTHDKDGEYGHWQHKIVSAAVVEAARLCADPTYDPISLAQFGTWEVKKCFVHLWPENTVVMDINTPLASRGGRTAFKVAQDAYKKHWSQQGGRHFVQSENDRFALNRFGMAYGTVEVGSDVFDNIDPMLLSSYVPPEETPTPEPTEEPTPEPTEAPTEAPTEQPIARAAEQPTPEPSEQPTPMPVPAQAPSKEPTDLFFPIALGVALVIIAVLGILLIRSRKRS